MTSDFQSLLQDLYSLQRLGIKTGLEHTHQLLDACNNPHKRLKFIHLAGTNGKGSTATFIDSILRASGLKIGLYTSPHLLRFNERIRVNGIPISDEKIVEFMQVFSVDIHRIESTFFETTSAMAFWYFEQEKVDIAVIETGLGGRLDSTNVITPEMVVITPVSMDHRELLGNDLKTVAKEKAGTIKENILVISSQQEAPVQEIFVQKAAEMDAQLMLVELPDKCTVSTEGTVFQQCGSKYQLSLIGEHQAQNAMLAIAVINHFIEDISENHIRTGLKNAVWPGRFQVLSHDPYIIYDVAHNEDGIRTLLKTVKKIFKKRPIGLCALKEDKDLELIANAIQGHFEKLYVLDDEKELLMDSKVLSSNLNKQGVKAVPLKQIKDFAPCLYDNHPGIIFGSHYIAEPIFKHFQFSFDSGTI